MRQLLEHRFVLSIALSLVLGAWGASRWPFPANDALIATIQVAQPQLHAWLGYLYATLWFSTPCLVLNVLGSLTYILIGESVESTPAPRLPPYPAPSARDELFLIVGEQHHRTSPEPVSDPRWLTIPERGLYTGIAIVGAIGSGKTSACMYPYLEQLLAFRAKDESRRLSALVLEVKGDFCHHVKRMLAQQGRAEDYVEISLSGPYRYNPLHNDLDAYALAYGIATLMTNLFGRGKEPFWQQASTNLVKFVILLHQTLDDYVTLFEVYEDVINPDRLRAAIEQGERRFQSGNRRVVVAKRVHLLTTGLAAWTWHSLNGAESWTCSSPELIQLLDTEGFEYRVEAFSAPDTECVKSAQFDAVKRWFENDWMRIEPKLRTSIVEGVSVFLSLFDDNPAVKHTFCPPKATYDPVENGDHRHGIALPPLSELVERGKVIALNFPVAMNPGLARALGTMLKQDFQRAVLNRIPRMVDDPDRVWRPVVFMCDEYQAFATVGEHEPSGDEKFFSLARQARCIPIVATQSISSLRSTLPGESWRTLLQGFRTKVFLALSDDFSARMAADLCGKAERLKPGYSLTETGQDANVSLLTGRPSAGRSTVSAAKTYTLLLDYVFQPKVFAELKNAQSVLLAYDGLDPQPPTLCYLKPYYLDDNVSYFEHLRKGAL